MKKETNPQNWMKKYNRKVAVILFFISFLSSIVPILGPGFLSYLYFFEFDRIAKIFTPFKGLALLIGGQILASLISLLFVPPPFSLLVYGFTSLLFILGHFISKFIFAKKKRNYAVKKV